MVTRRRIVLALAAGALAAPIAVRAQQPPKVYRVGFLDPRSRSTPSNPDFMHVAFVQGMGELGYFEGKNLVIEWRFADGKLQRLPELAADLPIEQPTKFDLAVNLKTAKALGIKIPNSILVQATKVIE